MSSAQQTQSRERIIIHHLSDLHYEDTPEGRKRNVLVKYKGYLESLPDERRPDVIVITGDMTSSGSKQDLKMVATILRTWFPTWENELHKHVFIVPGPRDVNWEGAGSPGLGAFFESFNEFALPALDGASSSRAAPGAGSANFLVYPIDTCYAPDELQEKQKGEFTEYATRYEAFAKQRDQLGRRRWWGLFDWGRKREDAKMRQAALKALREQFLALTEGAPPAALDAGRVMAGDVQRFQGWAKTFVPAQPAPQAPASEETQATREEQTPFEPLKILITHHPLAIQADQPEQQGRGAGDGAGPAALRSFQLMARTARGAGFHLALHGHIHKPQVLSDLSILEGLDVKHPMRQIGAASLGDTGLFNEITAYYREDRKGEKDDKAQGVWRLELRLVNVMTDTAERDGASSFVLLNPAETADDKAEPLQRSLERREEFERRMRIGLRRYSELVHETQYETRPEKLNGLALPQDTLQFIEAIIRDVIFDGFQVRVRLLLKSVEAHRPLPKLVPKYLTPAVLEGPESLAYPASVAAWSMVLGRTLIYPKLMKESTTADDHDWLRRSDKITDLLKALEQLTQDAFERSYPASEATKRYGDLSRKLTMIRNSGDMTISGNDMYQETPGGSQAKSYPWFICVPYPMRPAGGALPTLPEVATLDIGVRPASRPVSQRESATPEEPFTDERIDMLETLMELIGQVLTTSSALGKPRGVWDDRSSITR